MRSIPSILVLAFSTLPSLVLSAVLPGTLDKRDQQALYLANCLRCETINSDDCYEASYAAWYSDNLNAIKSLPPSSLSSEYRDWARGGVYLAWAGFYQTLTFPDSGTSVTTRINADVNNGNYKPAQQCGEAWRSSDNYHFTCYLDTGRQLFLEWPPNVPDGSGRYLKCFAEFFCF